MRAADRAALSTLQGDAGGWPYPSLVMAALDYDATPLLLLSTLADHTRNIQADARVGLLFDGTGDLDQPLAGARVSVLGRAVADDRPRSRARFLARHPGAAMYADFADFAIHRVVVERAHLVAGFGRVHWIEAADLLLSGAPGGLDEHEDAVVRHMNEDHADAVQLYATVLLGLSDQDESGRGWAMTGLDPEGCDLRRGGEVARLDFDRPVHDAEEARVELVRLARRASRVRQDGAAAAAASPY